MILRWKFFAVLSIKNENFAGDAGTMVYKESRGVSSFTLLALVWAKRHDVNPNGVWKSCVKSICLNLILTKRHDVDFSSNFKQTLGHKIVTTTNLILHLYWIFFSSPLIQFN
ncbi:hypothetical protein A9267_14600 [Shewanella sp. UCD-FRSSP16_17]|nr:hypothetical protein A9267_14600 [Shewanella sp. UCD-FRSSP16_17]